MTIGDILSHIFDFFIIIRINSKILFNNILNTKIEDIFFLIVVLGFFGFAVVLFIIYKSFIEQLNNKYLRFFLNPFIILIILLILIFCFGYFVSYCYDGTYNTNNPINSCF